MNVCLITGAAGLIGSEAVYFFKEKGFKIIGIDNDMRSYFFGKEASTNWNLEKIKNDLQDSYSHFNIDIRDEEAINNIFKVYSSDIKCIIHTAAQPSHDYPAKAERGAITDFTINALGTLYLLEATKKYCPESVFIFTSTNKVYGDSPNYLPLIEKDTRWEVSESHKWYDGIDETMSIDNTKHSIFGASKAAADLMTQEYGKYFGMKTGIFRGGCLTSHRHSGCQLHGFLSYLVKCIVNEEKYKIFGYKKKQVRDNIHSYDVISAFWEFYQNPKCGEVYNLGGTRYSNCSMIEAISYIESKTNKKAMIEYVGDPRIGDHIWYISLMKKFKKDFPNWKHTYNIYKIIDEIISCEKESKI
jgi:CDP-paratose 2-epimerase